MTSKQKAWDAYKKEQRADRRSRRHGHNPTTHGRAARRSRIHGRGETNLERSRIQRIRR